MKRILHLSCYHIHPQKALKILIKLHNMIICDILIKEFYFINVSIHQIIGLL